MSLTGLMLLLTDYSSQQTKPINSLKNTVQSGGEVQHTQPLLAVPLPWIRLKFKSIHIQPLITRTNSVI